MADASKLKQGSIVWIQADDEHGRNPKVRAFVIMDSTSVIRPGNSVVAVAVTGTFREPVSKVFIPMRWNASGTTETGFRKKCFAKCDWAITIPIVTGAHGRPEFEGVFDGRFVRGAEMLKILEGRAHMARNTGKL